MSVSPCLMVLLNRLVERGLLTQRTRGRMRGVGSQSGVGVSTRDSLDGRGLHSSTFHLNISRVGHTSPCPPV